MKKITVIMAAIAALLSAYSCQQVEQEAPETNEGVATRFTATFAKTKVLYNEEGTNLQPQWESGDQIVAINMTNERMTDLYVKEVLSDGRAVLDGVLTIGEKYRLVYKTHKMTITLPEPGNDPTLLIEYPYQEAVKNIPAVMLCQTSEISSSESNNFEFHNAGAIVGITAVKGVPLNSKVDKIILEGKGLTSGTIFLNDKFLASGIEAANSYAGSLSTSESFGAKVKDSNGTLDKQLYFAIPQGSKIEKVTVRVEDKRYSYTLSESPAIDKSDYFFVKTQTFTEESSVEKGHKYIQIGDLKWATTNIGAENPHDSGWYFSSANITGYYPVKTQPSNDAIAPPCIWYKPSDETPFTNGFTLANYGSTPGSDLREFDYSGNSTYDAASALWGGDWRMPTRADYEQLISKTYFAYDATDKGYYVFLPAVIGGEPGLGTTEGLNINKAVLFFPLTGSGKDNTINNWLAQSEYLVGELFQNTNGELANYTLNMDSSHNDQNFGINSTKERYKGRVIRPVSGNKSGGASK